MSIIYHDIVERVRWWYRRNAWLLFVIGMSIGVLMAVWGFCAGQYFYFGSANKLQWADAAYYILQMISLNGFGPFNPEIPWQLNVARFWLPTVFFFTAVSEVLRLIGRNGIGLSRFTLDQHIIVCGHSMQAIQLVRQYRQENRNARVLLVSNINDFDGAAQLRALGVLLHMDDASTQNCWRALRTSRARAIYFLDENAQRNLAAYAALRSIESQLCIPATAPVCPCFIHVPDPALRRWAVEAYERACDRNALPHYQWFFFSAWERTARELFLRHGPHHNSRDRLQNEAPAMLILGSNPLAEQLLLAAAQLGHYPGMEKLHVTVVDEQATRFGQSVQARFPALDERLPERWAPEEQPLIPLLDLQLIATTADTPPLTLFATPQDGRKPFQVCFVCVDDTLTALRVVDMLRARKRHTEKQVWPRIVLCLPREDALLESMFLPDDEGVNPEWTLFDPLVYGCRLESDETILAENSEHEAMDIYHYFIKSKDFNWWGLSDLERDSNRLAAEHLKIKRHFLDRDDDAMMKAEHQRWCAERLLAGWRFGTVKDPENRISPNLKVYQSLPDTERDKNNPIITYARNTPSVLKESR